MAANLWVCSRCKHTAYCKDGELARNCFFLGTVHMLRSERCTECDSVMHLVSRGPVHFQNVWADGDANAVIRLGGEGAAGKW